MNSSHPLFLAALVCYFLSAGLYHVRLFVRTVRSGSLARWVAAAGFACHTTAVVIRSIELGHAPYVELQEAMATVAWAVVFLMLLVEWKRKTFSFGAPAMALAAILMFLAETVPAYSSQHPLSPVVYNNRMESHIGAIVSAFGAFGLAFCAAILYLVQERRLKEKKYQASEPGALSLVEIEQMANALAAFGFTLLTLGLVLGFLWAASGVWTGAWYTQPIVLATVATWVVYGIYLYVRSIRGERGRHNMYLLIAGFSLAALTLLFVRTLLPGQHQF